MGKVYEALRRSSNADDFIDFRTQSDADRSIVPFPFYPPKGSDDQEGFESLKTNFLTRYAKQSIKTVLFSGVSPGCGTSTMAAYFAASLTKDTLLKVLLIDANLRSPSIHRFFSMKTQPGLLDLLTKDNGEPFEIMKCGRDHLYVLSSGGVSQNPAQLLASNRFFRFIEKMRANLDYIIIDAPLSSCYPESKMICHKLDGIVLVAEARKSRRQVALRIKKDFEASGGKILGTVLNKRRYYIPGWIYRHI